MARKYWRRRRPDKFADVLASFVALFALGLVGWIYTHRDQLLLWSLIALGIVALGVAALLILRKYKKKAALNWDDDKILFMLKGMSPSQFEHEMAKMFDALGYQSEAWGTPTTAALMLSPARREESISFSARNSSRKRPHPMTCGIFSARSPTSTTPPTKAFS